MKARGLEVDSVEAPTEGTPQAGPRLYVVPASLSPWTRSTAKRVVDVALVLAMLPLFAPLCLLIAVAIRLTSRGPAFFLQKRAGAGGKLFSIVKFRTMVHPARPEQGSITTIDDEQITALGRVLRYWKMDELPQLWNVLRGEMSLVGPRPRVPEQQTTPVSCRPGITGAASLVFAREEVMLAGIPRDLLATYYASRVLPIKQRMDDEYMAQATFFSDAKLLLRTVLRVWTPAGALDVIAMPGRIQEAVMPGESCD